MGGKTKDLDSRGSEEEPASSGAVCACVRDLILASV